MVKRRGAASFFLFLFFGGVEGRDISHVVSSVRFGSTYMYLDAASVTACQIDRKQDELRVEGSSLVTRHNL